jgi:molybdopterin-biosynthesis enzyme MoeA-like protein
VLPGIPQYFSNKMKIICKNFLEKNQALEVRRIALDIEERFLVGKLNNLVSKHNKVKFGSYPYIDHPEYKCIITVEGVSKDDVDIATEDLINVFINNKM